MSLHTINFPGDGASIWAGMGDLLFVAPDKTHKAEVVYVGEPPHGDSFHALSVDGVAFPEHVWGCNFAWSPCSRYLACSWMPGLVQERIRFTVIIDVMNRMYFFLDDYFYDFAFDGFCLVELVSHNGQKVRSGRSHMISGDEAWISY